MKQNFQEQGQPNITVETQKRDAKWIADILLEIHLDESLIAFQPASLQGFQRFGLSPGRNLMPPIGFDNVNVGLHCVNGFGLKGVE